MFVLGGHGAGNTAKETLVLSDDVCWDFYDVY